MATVEFDPHPEGFEDITETKDRGILKKVIKEGYCDIKPCPEDRVIVHYVGTYYGGDKHGEQFDSSRDRNEKFEFTIGKGEVIKAWDIGVATMKLGEICELIASPDYCYLDDKSMKFVIELFDTQGKDVSPSHDGSVRMSVLEKGRDHRTPLTGLDAEISYRPFTNDLTAFRDVSYTVGDPAAHEVPDLVDLAIPHMHTAEKCLVRKRKLDAAVGDNENLSEEAYEVRLRSFEKAKPLSTLVSFSEQMECAEALKTKANDYFKASKFKLALSLYERLAQEIPYVVTDGVEQAKTVKTLETAVNLNMALLFLKLGDANKCSEQCKKVLEVDASNEKALFRLGQACLLRKDHEEAEIYFRRIVRNNPNNTAAAHQLQLCEETLRIAKEKERKMFRGMFERFKQTGLENSADSNATVNEVEQSAA